jgi:plasmid stabilization system protein ParE
MPSGDKSKYTDKQKRKADHIAASYEFRGVPEDEAEARAWATVNKESGGDKLSGSGRVQRENHASSQKKGGRLGGRTSASRPAAARSLSAKKAAATRKGEAEARTPASLLAGARGHYITAGTPCRSP